LAIFKFAGLVPDDYAAAAGLLLGEFSHEDLIFEFGSDTFCVILPQHDLDQAIVRSELVMKKAEGLKEKEFKKPFEITVGLTSRNGRLLDASRFMKEGQVALRKASREEGRIVGFRPDPVRFRNFLRHQRV
jgi:GGDEF domain-containing protein